MIRGLFFDLDGTVYNGNSMIPGAVDFFREMKNCGIHYLFITNRSHKTPEDIADRLKKIGIPCDANDILTSAQAAAEFVKKSRVFYIGENGLAEALRNVGAIITQENPKYVVVGYDGQISMKKIEMATRLIKSGSKFVGTNPDVTITTQAGTLPENGVIIAAIAAASGCQPIIIGKPERMMIDIALKRISLSREEVILVGDNLDTDIKAGISANIHTVLITTGISSKLEAQESLIRPTWVVESYDELKNIVCSLIKVSK